MKLVGKASSNVGRAKATPRSSEAVVRMYNCFGKEIGKHQLDKKIFDGSVNKALLYQAINMYNANARQGNASTKTREFVSGGGKKPWRQKGTGRARAGSSRSPLWRGGGIVFGPHPRDYSYDMPKKMKNLAFLASFNAKLNEDKVIGLDAIQIDEPKTKKFKAIMDALNLAGRSLFVVDSIDDNTRRATRNIQQVSVRNYKDFNVMDVLTCDTVVMTKAALDKLPERVEV